MLETIHDFFTQIVSKPWSFEPIFSGINGVSQISSIFVPQINSKMKKVFTEVFALVIFALASACPAFAGIDAAWVKENYTKREVKITMRDGVQLHTIIYEPVDKSVKHPAIMTRTCYGVAPYGEAYARLESPTYSTYTEAGYIFIFQDVRGKNKSGGEFEDIRPFIEGKKAPKYNRKGEIIAKAGTPVDEASDTYDTADWIVKNTSSNGNIGVYGISYPGFYSTMAALSGHPAIKAVSPQAPVTDWYRGDDVHHNGAFFLLDMYSFQFWFEHQNVQDKPRAAVNPSSIVRNDVYTDYLRYKTVRNLSDLLQGQVVGWNNVLEHPDLDEWWEAHNVTYHCHDVKPAIMVVGGLFDAEDCYGAWKTYESIREQSPATDLYLVEGPWSHGQWSRGATDRMGDIWFGDEISSDWYIANIEYPFFSYYLEGKGEKPANGARVFHTGENRWHYYKDGWEPGKASVELDLNGAEYTSDPARPVPHVGKPGTGRRTRDMLEDQRFAASRPDVAVFVTDVLTDSLRLSGEVLADLQVSITGTDADFIVKIIDVYPEGFRYPREIASGFADMPLMSGYQMLVRWDVMRGKYRNSLSNPEPFVPGEKTQVKFALPGAAHTFLPGHRVMVQIQSSCFPLVDINPQTFCDIYSCDESAFRKADITIHPDSRIVLPVRPVNNQVSVLNCNNR